MHARISTLVAIALAVPAIARAQNIPPPAPQQPAPTTGAPQPFDPNGPTNPYGQPPPPNGPGQPPAPYAPPPPPGLDNGVPPPPPPGEVEMVCDFGAVGLLAGITIDVRGVHDPSLGTMVVLGSTAGGGAVGWILADHFQATRGDAYLTTLGLTVGAANGALLLQPTHNTQTADQVLGVLTLSSAVGATAGFAASRGEKLTAGQSLFATNVTFLGFGSAALIASLMDNNHSLDNSEISALAIGLDGGAAAGLILAPKVDWSQRRANVVGMGSLVGTFIGGMVAGLASPRQKNADGSTSTEFSPDFVATSLLVGAWAGFGASIYLTKDMPPDPQYDPRYHPQQSPPVSVTPFVRGDSFGAAIGGSW
jgi:hypothetical protein